MMAGYTQPMRSWQSFSLSLPLNCDFHHNAITRQKKKKQTTTPTCFLGLEIHNIIVLIEQGLSLPFLLGHCFTVKKKKTGTG